MVLFLRALRHTLLIVGPLSLTLGLMWGNGWLIGGGICWGVLALMVGHWIRFFQQGDKS